jgi:hypothetical protein
VGQFAATIISLRNTQKYYSPTARKHLDYIAQYSESDTTCPVVATGIFCIFAHFLHASPNALQQASVSPDIFPRRPKFWLVGK